jgi:DNA-binding NarL/FixJ family response regulator
MIFKPVKLAIADDHALFRKTLKNFLSGQQNVTIPIQAADMSDLSNKLKDNPVDVLFMNFFLPGLQGHEGVKSLIGEFPDIKILILSTNADIESISRLMETGIHGCISKFNEPGELIDAIKIASENRIYRNDLLTEALYFDRQNAIRAYRSEAATKLTKREKKILQLMWEEKSSKEIAHEIFLGVRSVEKLRQVIKKKIGAKSSIGLMKYAIDQKIILPVSPNQVSATYSRY